MFTATISKGVEENTVMVNKWLELKDNFQLLPFLFFHFYDVDFQKKTFLDFRKNIVHMCYLVRS